MADAAPRKLGRTGREVSPIGFGGYRVDDETPSHQVALEHALARGVRLVDTSTNYTDGGSERLLGKVLAGHTDVALVSKVGYVQGQNLTLAYQRESEGRPFADMVRYSDGCWHCLAPEWIHDQLGRSLERLARPRLDVYLLHNPEYFLTDAKKRRDPRPLEAIREQFYQRIERAFAALEVERAAGRIGWYGVSSNTFGAPAGDPEFVALDRLWAIAEAIGGPAHGFAVIQLPLNLFESRPALEPNQPHGTVLDEARAHELGVLVNRPLNAFQGGDLVRLADPVPRGGAVSITDALAFVGALEAEWRSDFAPQVRTAEARMHPMRWFRWAEELGQAHARSNIQGLMHWREIEEHSLWPQVEHLLPRLVEVLGETAASWADRYRTGLGTLADALHDQQAARAREAYAPLKRALVAALPQEWEEAPLSHAALRTVIDTPGVSSVLVGMRRVAYVNDALAAAARPAIAAPLDVYRALRRPLR